MPEPAPSAKVKLYVGCALTHAPDEFRHSVDGFKRALRVNGYEVFDFMSLGKGTAADVYTWDIGHCVRDCDAFIAICDIPSLGLGWELGVAASLRKPMLLLAHRDSKVTRQVIGAADVEQNVQFERYADLLDVLPDVARLVGKIQK